MFSYLCVLFLISSVIALEIEIPNPPPADNEDEWRLIPDEEGKLHLVNVISSMNEPQPFFNVDIGVIFELYTQKNPHNRQIIRLGNVASLASSYFNASHVTRIVAHGWNAKGDLTTSFANAYFRDSSRNVNLIAINWQAGSNTINYISARRRVSPVGAQIARFIDFLVEIGHLHLEDLILIGHSLGGHAVGIAGKHITTGQIPKIIALDPANPLFNYQNVNERIASGDARSVEIIHSAAGSLGFSAPLGDASFYPNGGRSQPGCGLDLTGACAHSRAHEFYIESINSDVGFYSWNCRSYAEMRNGRCNVIGDDLIRMGGDPGNQGKANGVFFLNTNRSPPFALGRPRM